MAYLDAYPRGRPAGAEEFFYWSVVDFGLKPTVRVNHVVIYPLAARPSGVSHVIAIKQLYASHYFHTTLELRFLADDDRRPDRRGFYLLSITRSRIDGTTGLKGSLCGPSSAVARALPFAATWSISNDRSSVSCRRPSELMNRASRGQVIKRASAGREFSPTEAGRYAHYQTVTRDACNQKEQGRVAHDSSWSDP